MNSFAFEFDVPAFQKMLRDRVMAQAKATQGDLKSRASEMQKKLASPDMAADLSRYEELNAADSPQALAGDAKEELAKLRVKTAEATAMTEDISWDFLFVRT